ncbi:hypothetical protein EV175_003260 [Coemansia sp. RSA 1933]|nr:hypothetical protein EV175_003260 [Coemansia sp. RSA 1933]
MSVPYLLVDTVTFKKPTSELLLAPPTADRVSSSCTSSTMKGSESPSPAAFKGLAEADNNDVVSSWASNALAITTTGTNAVGEAMSAHVQSEVEAKNSANSVLFMSYPTPENQISIKTPKFGPAVNFDYSGPDMMFDTTDSGVSGIGATDVSTLALAVSTDAAAQYSEQVASATGPLSLHSQLETPPLSLGAVTNNHDISPVTTVDSAAGIIVGDISSIMHSGISRALPLSESGARASMDSFVAGISIDAKTSSMLHMQSYGASPNGADTESAGNNNSGFSSADRNIGRPELATHRSLATTGMRPESALFPSLLHRVCEDPQLHNIAYWDEKGNVCIPVMETLRKTLNSMGMTAHHTDSLQKNFNDYQFKRMTDQRRTRHTNQHGVVKFQNPNFVPGRPDLLNNIVRKSALKKQQSLNSRDRANSGSFNRKKTRSSSVRQANGRVVRQTMSDRMNPYMRYGHVDQSAIHGLPISTSPSNTFQSHQHGPQVNTLSQVYNSGDQSGMIMPLDVQNFGFNIQQPPVGMGEQVNPSLLQSSNPQYQQSPFYVAQNQPSLVMQSFMPPSQASFPSSYAQTNDSSVAHTQGYQHNDFSLPSQYQQQQQASEFGHGHQQNYSPMPLPQHSYADIHQHGYYAQHQITTPGYPSAGPEATAPDAVNNGSYNA